MYNYNFTESRKENSNAHDRLQKSPEKCAYRMEYDEYKVCGE